MIKKYSFFLFNELKNLFFLFLISFFVYFIFINPDLIITGVDNGLNICLDVIIPSLFPFMVLCGFMGLSPIANIFSKGLSPITKYIFKLPQNVGVIILISFIGGYPMGAKMVADFLKDGKISLKVADRLICFCVNAGPAFIITAIGYMIYGSRKIGLFLLIAHLLGSVIIGIVLGSFYKFDGENGKINEKKTFNTLGYPQAFVKSVIDGGYAIFNICAFVIIFSVITIIFQNCFYGNQFVNLLLSLLEVTVGMNYILDFDGTVSLLLSSFLISFSGLSVIFQLLYFIKNTKINKKKFFLFRLIHGIISVVILYIEMFFMKDVRYASLMIEGNEVRMFNLSPGISLMIFLLANCFIIFSYSEFFDKK